MGLKLVATTLLLVVLCSEISSFRLQKREAQEEAQVLTQLQEAAKGYWDQVSNTTLGWFGQIKTLGFNQKLSDMYEKGTSAVGTYWNIISDQLYHHWHGDQ
ncbi:apolipoprotein C-II-like [Anolis sagrei]|uniref:apolipoprotein C-II-like n=1 Tax=Anolis sagrei TaxID=38937 RepID=UPI00351FC0CA